ncbi:MAG: biopolymer transporter ExbD [Polyangiaceae bacterium]|nr:biopolymer transporter ExbD [Polyangiaceae bacterium]
MAGTTARGRKGGIVGINVTPMVDVVLVLLVIMMVSATYIVSQSLKVELPKTSTSDQAPETVATVTITKDGALLFDQDPIDEAGLTRKLREAKQAGSDVSLVVSADTEAFHGAVVRVIDLAKLEGITKFAIRVERKE